uniref:Uncharacterized protein n=1 Tax=uncultured prokaryote TaxID=198431 RepID=A0A0H5QLR4_9ZZZZ|nr:hypothetical protein [uncultured prokaryote]
MASTRGLDDLPRDLVDDFPGYVRQAFHAYRQSSAALRLYRRRGWNDSAVRLQHDRNTSAVTAAIEKWEHREMNPSLF